MAEEWYLKSPEETLALLKSSKEGLSYGEANKRLKEHGPNHLAVSKDRSLWALFFSQFVTLFVLILFIAAAIKFFLGDFLDTIVLLITLVVLILLGFFQEMKAEKALRALKQLSAHRSKVKREGKLQVIDSEHLVVGDLILLEMGDKVPADARLIEVHELSIDESMLSGESLPSEKKVEALHEGLALADRKNMIYSGTVVAFGKASAVVIAIASDTELGKIASSLESIEQEPTPLQKNIQLIGRWMAVAIVFAVSILFLIGLYRGIAFADILLLAVAAAVSAMPEGLPAAFTVTLASGMHLMAKRNAIIRRLSAVETLGSATVICSDKTGTLTCNQMTVTKLYAYGKLMPVDKADAKRCFEIAALCNDALLSKGHEVIGEPTEASLVLAAAEKGVDQARLIEVSPRKGEISFVSENRYMATLHKGFIYVKGAPEKVLSMSSQMLGENGPIPLERAKIEKAIEEMTSKALRLIAVAYVEVGEDVTALKDFQIDGKLIFAGIFGIIDPPRTEVIQAIAMCKEAGVRVVMVTGDNPMTASAIAESLGIESEEVITGQDLHSLDDASLKVKVAKASVFARVDPVHKLRIVKAFQSMGSIVAMTGDGINDAPALEAANIGVAMGITGTDVAKEAADMILADDRFDSIVAAIEEGRAIFNRLRSICTLLLLTCFGELFGLMLSVVFTGVAPLIPVQILWVNFVSGAMVSVPLGFEPKTGEEMKQPPRSFSSRILYPGMMYRVIFYASLLGLGIVTIFECALVTVNIDRARTMAVCSLLVFEWLITLKMRSDEVPLRKLGFKNPVLFLSIGIAICLHLCIVYIPFFQQFFHTEGLSLREWSIVAIPGIFAFIIETLRKEFFPSLFSAGKWK